MRCFEPGQNVSVYVRFDRDGEPFIPDTGSVKWSARGHSGTILTGYSNVALSPAATDAGVLLTVLAAENTITAPRRFEIRTIELSATVGYEPFKVTLPYRLMPYLNHQVTCASVRAEIGVDTGELPDAEIDIVSAYLMIEDRVTQSLWEAALISGTRVQDAANEALRVFAALDALPALRQRLLLQHTDGSINARRNPLDLDKLMNALAAKLATAIQIVTGQLAPAFGGFVIGANTDIITGV